MNATSCYHCKSQESAFYASENGFTLVKCDRCGLLYVADRPDDVVISQANKQGKHGGLKESDSTGSFDSSKIPRYIKALDDMYRGDLGPIDSWLDVGCGHGEFVSAIETYSNRRVSVTGTEPNVRKRASARQRGLHVDYFDLDTHEGKYDCISLLNVYSHLPDPPSFLASLKKLLNPAGELVLETGDTAHLSSDLHYRPFYLPDHLSFASESIVVGILEDLGFATASVHKYPFVKFGAMGFAKEVVKIFIPGESTDLRNALKGRRTSHTDMFIRARLTSARAIPTSAARS